MNFLSFGANRKTSRALFLAKFWMWLAACGIGLNLLLVLTLLQMTPKLKVLAQLIPSPGNTHEYVQLDALPAPGILSINTEYNSQSKILLDEMLIRYYLDQRISIIPDEAEMYYRWGANSRMRKLSSPALYNKFANNLSETITKIKEQRHTRSVDILSVSNTGNIYTVEFNVYTFNQYSPHKKPTVQRRVATIEIGHAQWAVSYNPTGANPYGFYIKSYNESIKRIKN